MNFKDTTEAKQPYTKPELKVYGSIRDITNTTGTTSMVADGGMGINNKT